MSTRRTFLSVSQDAASAASPWALQKTRTQEGEAREQWDNNDDIRKKDFVSDDRGPMNLPPSLSLSLTFLDSRVTYLLYCQHLQSLGDPELHLAEKAVLLK